MNGLEWLVAQGARKDVVIVCGMLAVMLIAGLFVDRLQQQARLRMQQNQRATTAGEPGGDSAAWMPSSTYPEPASLQRGQVPPKAAPLPADFTSASLHAEHALAEARADLHRAVQRGICESEVAACRSAFRAALARYQAITTAEYHL